MRDGVRAAMQHMPKFNAGDRKYTIPGVGHISSANPHATEFTALAVSRIWLAAAVALLPPAARALREQWGVFANAMKDEARPYATQRADAHWRAELAARLMLHPTPR
jgi:hypothetical protein